MLLLPLSLPPAEVRGALPGAAPGAGGTGRQCQRAAGPTAGRPCLRGNEVAMSEQSRSEVASGGGGLTRAVVPRVGPRAYC